MPVPNDPRKLAQWRENIRKNSKAMWDDPASRAKMLQARKEKRRFKEWTEEEENILREKYLTIEAPALLKLLPGHSVNTIYAKVRSMGLIKSSPRISRKELRATHHFLSSDLFLPNEGEKACLECRLIKPHIFFAKVAKARDGYRLLCKLCYRSHNQEKTHKRIHPYRDVEPIAEIFPEGHKRCPICKEIKLLQHFNFDKRNKDGRGANCRNCLRLTKEEIRKNNLNKYEITQEDFDIMFQAQNGVCASCGNAETAKNPAGEVRPLSIDHCHRLNVVRGLLCSRCNTSLGLLFEDPNRIKALLKYIEERCLW